MVKSHGAKMDYLFLPRMILILTLPGMAWPQTYPLPEEWQKAIMMKVASQKFGEVITMTGGPPPPTPATDPMALLCPNLLLWSPQESYKNFLTGKVLCPVCLALGHSQALSPWRWQLGTTERTQPRKIHDSKGIVLLVSRVSGRA